MIAVETLLGFVLTCFLIELTPGPNMAYLAILSIDSGRRAGFATLVGIALGLLIVGAASAFGLAALIAESPPLYATLRWGGVFYLLWLAWSGWNKDDEASPGCASDKCSDTQYFRRGLVINLLNPKAAVFYIAVLPGFIGVTHTIAQQAIVLTIVYVLIACAVHLAIVLMAVSARTLLENPYDRRRVRRVLAALLALVALWLGFTTAR